MGRRFLRGEQQDSLARLEKALADLSKRLDDHAQQTTHRFHRVLQVLERMVDDEPANRRLLLAARQAEDYERAYTDPDQLVSVLIPTFENAEGLRERSLPSVLAQTNENLEVLVVGDAAPQAVADVVADVADPRVRWYNRPYRGPYPDDEQLLWLVSGDAPWNDALGLARGQWIAPFADDDAMRPDALASVLAEARRSHLELCYGALEMHHRDGRRTRLGTFPPKLHEFGL